MLNWLKKHFIPHEGNNHRPHFLCNENIRNILILIVFVEVFAFLGPTLSQINKTGGMATVLPAVLSSLTNEERQSQNLSTLTTNPFLQKAAEMKANDMATKSYFAHTSPEGKTPWYWLEQVGYKYQYAGENLAINFTDSKDVTNAWMNSPSHKANIMKNKYTEVGTGIATGMYEGRETVFVAQIYANPLLKVTKTKETTSILGAETITNIGNNPDSIQIDKLIIIDQTPKPTFLQTLFASPRNSTNVILFVILGIVTIALILYILVKIKNHHPDLILNGLIVIVMLGAIFVANYYLSHHNMFTTQSIDYSLENK